MIKFCVQRAEKTIVSERNCIKICREHEEQIEDYLKEKFEPLIIDLSTLKKKSHQELLKYTFSDLTEGDKAKKVKDYNNLTEEWQEVVRDWLYKWFVFEDDIKKGALDYFWFLESSKNDGFESINSCGIYSKFEDFLNGYDWKNWNEDFSKLSDDFLDEAKKQISDDLCQELKSEISNIEVQLKL